MSFRIVTSALLLGTFLFAAGSASAAEEPEAKHAFGDSGQFALSLNQNFLASTNDLFGSTELRGSYFVADHVSIGLGLGAQWFNNNPIGGATSTGGSLFTFRAAPRFGYDVTLSEQVSFWPQIGIDYRHASESGGGFDGNALGFAAEAPLLFHPVKGFFVGGGPSFYTEFFNHANAGSLGGDMPKQTTVGLMATIGGAF
jgi:hypothetical protein